MKVKYIDTICTNTQHVIFNASLIAMLSNLYKDISCYGEKNNMKDVLNILENNHINTSFLKIKNIPLPITYTGIRFFFVYILSFFYNLYFIISANKKELLVFNYNNLMAVRSMNFINKLFNRNILIFCHGEMEFLISDIKKYGPLNSLLWRFAHHFFLNKNIQVHPKIKFVVMGDAILEHMRKTVPNNIEKAFISVDHSYFFNNDSRAYTPSKQLKVGTVGVFSKMKGGDDFCRLYHLVDKSKVEFSITGRIFYDMNIINGMDIDLPNNKGVNAIDREELEMRTQELDTILFFYPKDSYKLIASGAIMDAISMKKPIIAIRNSYFSYIFKKFGTFGFLVDSVEEMAKIIERLKKEDLIFDFDTIQKRMSISSISEQLKEQLTKMNLL
ncbi:glycosyltransferase family 1 protein [uncultured Capnocytophaga sp.]|uniref:glycosyltransferase family 1 protein n=1 Tax=uncultured Capnocytophaga sp. TaxID=159273 RepID=UPI00260F63D5|nr:glycosyltransferase family 1 protein [uncultured Capnocytophaga sp.]